MERYLVQRYVPSQLQPRCLGSRTEIRCSVLSSFDGLPARLEWRLTLQGTIRQWIVASAYATAATGNGYVEGERLRDSGDGWDVLPETLSLADWITGAPLHPTDGTWLPDWAKRFRQPAPVTRAFRAAIDSFPVASGKVPPGFTRTGPRRIKQGPARCSASQKLIRCSATGRMLRTETGKGPPVPVTVRWRLTKYTARSARVEIGVYASVDAPYDRATFSGPWKKGEWIHMPNMLQLGGTYLSGSDIPPSAVGLKQW